LGASGYRLLEVERPVHVQVRLRGEIEIHILDIDVHDQRFAIPERTSDIKSLIKVVLKPRRGLQLKIGVEGVIPISRDRRRSPLRPRIRRGTP